MTNNSRYDQLPYPYKLFIDNLINYDPNKAQFREYYIFVCEEAVKIHDAVKDQAQLEWLQSDSTEAIFEKVPALSFDHSPESLELARTMALVYRVNQEKLGNYEWAKENLPLSLPRVTIVDQPALDISLGGGDNLYMFFDQDRLRVTVSDSYGFIGVSLSSDDVRKVKDFLNDH